MEAQIDEGIRSRYSWLSVIVGIVSVIVGMWCILTPASTLGALTVLFIVGFFVAGAFELIQAFSTMNGHHWGWRLVTGIIDILLGIWLVAMPVAEAATTMVYVIGFWVFFYSAIGIGESIHMRKLGVGSWGWMLVCNVCGLICSFLFLMGPAFGAMFTVWLVGLSFVSYGIFRCMVPAV